MGILLIGIFSEERVITGLHVSDQVSRRFSIQFADDQVRGYRGYLLFLGKFPDGRDLRGVGPLAFPVLTAFPISF